MPNQLASQEKQEQTRKKKPNVKEVRRKKLEWILIWAYILFCIIFAEWII